VRVEIRPLFDEQVMAAELPIRKAAAKAVETLVAVKSFARLPAHKGLNFEKIHGMTLPETGDPIHSVRISRGARAFSILREGHTLVLVSLAVDHDGANRVGRG
jgi:hypothetical protein